MPSQEQQIADAYSDPVHYHQELPLNLLVTTPPFRSRLLESYVFFLKKKRDKTFQNDEITEVK